jgi:hypothetical protein
VNFKLNAAGEFIALTDADGMSLIDSVTTCMPPQDISEGRLPDGSTNIILFMPQTLGLTASPGRANPFPSILSMNSVPGKADLMLCFTLASNLSCTIQFQTGSVTNAWTDLTNIPPAAMSREIEISDPSPASKLRIYRVKL